MIRAIIDGREVSVPIEIMLWYRDQGYSNQIPAWAIDLYNYNGLGLS